jgi:signal transduction histidine kinase
MEMGKVCTKLEDGDGRGFPKIFSVHLDLLTRLDHQCNRIKTGGYIGNLKMTPQRNMRKPTQCNTLKYMAVLCIVFGMACNQGWSQALCLEVKGISQGSNEFIYRSRADRLFIASLDGLNIYDGVHTKVYRPATHTMAGNNMQSPFFEDSLGRVWFSTYQALHFYDPSIDDLEYHFMVSPSGDTIHDNYKVFYLDDQYVYLKAGKEVFVFDIHTKSIRQSIPLNLQEVNFIQGIPKGNDIIVAAATQDTLSLYTLNRQFGFQLTYQARLATRELLVDGNKIWIGTGGGKIYTVHADSLLLEHVYSTPTGKCSDIHRLNDSLLIVADFSDTLYFFNERTNTLDHTLGMISSEGRNAPLSGISEIYLDRHSLLWIAPVGLGLHMHNLKGRKFHHLLEGNDITLILPESHGRYVAQTRRNGIILFNKQGEIEKHWDKLPGEIKSFTSVNGIWMDRETLLFTEADTFFTINVNTGKIVPIAFEDPSEVDPFHCQRLSNGRIVVSNENSVLYYLTIDKGFGRYTPYVDLTGKTNLTLHFQEDKSGNLYVSNDDINVLVLKPEPISKSHVYSHTLSIPGGIKHIYDDIDQQVVYLACPGGLMRINKTTNAIEPVLDKQYLLAQTIYSIQVDKQGKLWLGTNSGLVCYDPATNSSHAYSRLDGIQWNEFNTSVCFQEADGLMWFGGINGLNPFYPEKIPIDTNPVRTMISSVRINDRADSSHLMPSWNKRYELPYDQNTIAFQFHAIDFARPQFARVRYKLEGIDEDYIESSAAYAEIRYPKLPTGEYVLSIYGQNGDGIWNKTPDEILISIGQPYWRTWWFIALVVGVVSGAVIMIVRGFYKRKFQRQAIVIERQQAIELERTRIAAEMHDDLGSGLTTIRYLSDKALMQASNTEEVAQIQRIADQSNTLVRNMSEIIWAMNSRFDNAESLIAYLRRYALEYLAEHQIPVTFNSHDVEDMPIAITGEKRRNIFLVVKEILHNTVKYSGAESVQMEISANGAFSLRIRELGGKGFDAYVARDRGNGLYNADRRMKSIGGVIEYEKKEESMDIALTVPLT